jgi:hypothetical protein
MLIVMVEDRYSTIVIYLAKPLWFSLYTTFKMKPKQ